MTQEQKDLKDLLLKDICSRLPYGVKFEHTDKHTLCKILSITPIYDYGNVIYFDDAINHPKKCSIDDVKPYLFPLSSMTDAEKEEYCQLQQRVIYNSKGRVNEDVTKYINWCYKKHLDINNLIPMDLAIDATNLNIY